MSEQLRWTDFNCTLIKTMREMGMECMNGLESRRQMYLHCYHAGFTLEDVANYIRGLAFMSSKNAPDEFTENLKKAIRRGAPTEWEWDNSFKCELTFDQLADAWEKPVSMENMLENAGVDLKSK